MGTRILLALTMAAATLLVLPEAGSAVNVAQPTLVSADPADYTPFIKDDPATPTQDKVSSVAVVGNRVVLGGQFSTVKNWQGGAPLLARRNLMAFDAKTGAVDTGFVPNVDGEVTSVRAAPGGTAVFVGGLFRTVNGAAAIGLAKLNVATGQRDPRFASSSDGSVLAMAVHGERLYVGGTFTRLGGVSHPYLAALDTTTGAVDPQLDIAVSKPWRNTVTVQHLDVSPAGDRLVMLGNFQEVGGLPRSQLAVIDLSTAPASVANWNTDGYRQGVCNILPDAYVRGLDISPDGRYFVVTATGAWHGTSTLCDTAARWELYRSGSTIQPTWTEYTGGDTLSAVAITGTVVYVGGHQRWMNNSLTRAGDSAGPGSVPRSGLAALDPVNGMVLSWNPGRERGVGVFEMVATPEGLYIAHDTDIVGGEYRPRITYFPLAGGSVVPQVMPARLPTTVYTAERDGRLLSNAYDGSSFGSPVTVQPEGWTHVRGAFVVDHDLYTGRDDGRLLKRSFDGTTFGRPVDVRSWTSFAHVTGMFFSDGRLYFTRTGDRRLFFRKFEPEDDVVGSQLFVASGDGDGLDWSRTAGMTMVGGKVYAADTSGVLRRFDLVAGVPAPGSMTVVNRFRIDNESWSTLAIFVL